MYDFLDDLPMFGIILYTLDIAGKDLIDLFVLLDKNQEQIMGGLSYLSLG